MASLEYRPFFLRTSVSHILFFVGIVETVAVYSFRCLTYDYYILISILYIAKIVFILRLDKKITSPLFFPTVVISFWYVFAHFLNIVTDHYVYYDKIAKISWLISLSYLTFIFGSIIGDRIKIRKTKRIIPYLRYSSFIKMLYFMILVSLAAQLIYDIPIVEALRTGNYFLNRIEMLYGRGYLMAFGSLQFYFITFLFLVKYKYNKKIIIFDYLLVLLSFLSIAITMQRGPLLIFILMFLFIVNDFKREISIKKVAVCSILLLSIFGVVIPYLRGIDRLFLVILGNEIGVHMWNLSSYIDLADNVGPFYLRPIWMALAIILPGHQDDFVIWVKQFSTISVDIGGASMSLMGEGYLELGVIGVIVSFMVLGIVLSVLYRRRQYSFGTYYLYLYFLVRVNSVLQFGFAKILLTMMILTMVLLLIDRVKLIDVGCFNHH